MKKIFYNQQILINSCIKIVDEDYHHLSRVLRVKKNETFVINSIDNKEFIGRIIDISKYSIDILIEKEFERMIKNKPEVIIIFSVLKSEKNDLIIKKCTEIGIKEFVPVITANTIVKISGNYLNKIKRWNKIARETAMQCCAEKIPVINNIKNFQEILNFDIESERYFCYKEDNKINIKKNNINNIMNKIHNKIMFFLGPEGDFTKNEILCLKEKGWTGLSLSENILRSETAAIYISSIVMYNIFLKSLDFN